MRKQQKKGKLNKKQAAVVSGLVFAIGLLICGLSIAFFSNRDVVTNQQKAKEITIRLMEPEWKETGEAKAAKLEPGMVIEKDPYVLNESEDDVYIRMKIVIKGRDENAEYGELTADSERCQAIWKAIYCKTSGTGGGTEGDTDGICLLDENGVSQNPDFVYENGWFYYKKAGETDVYTMVASGESTTRLFDNLQIPVLKKEYNGIFDTDFQIEVIAQAVSGASARGTETEEEKKTAIKNAFEKDYTQVSSVTSAETTGDTQGN